MLYLLLLPLHIVASVLALLGRLVGFLFQLVLVIGAGIVSIIALCLLLFALALMISGVGIIPGVIVFVFAVMLGAIVRKKE